MYKHAYKCTFIHVFVSFANNISDCHVNFLYLRIALHIIQYYYNKNITLTSNKNKKIQ